jgi:hypothetical protein
VYCDNQLVGTGGDDQVGHLIRATADLAMERFQANSE